MGGRTTGRNFKWFKLEISGKKKFSFKMRQNRILCQHQFTILRTQSNNTVEEPNLQLATRNSQLATRNSQLATRNSQLATRNSQLATRNSQLATRNSTTRRLPSPLIFSLLKRAVVILCTIAVYLLIRVLNLKSVPEI